MHKIDADKTINDLRHLIRNLSEIHSTIYGMEEYFIETDCDARYMLCQAGSQIGNAVENLYKARLYLWAIKERKAE